MTWSTQHTNPDQDWFRNQALAVMPNLAQTQFNNLNYTARITSRLASSTFFVSDVEIHQNRISSVEAADWARRQDEHLRGSEVIVVEGFIGPPGPDRVGSRLVIEATQPNIAAMQTQLYFPPDESWSEDLTVIYTPTLKAEGKPNDCLIIVDLDRGITRVFGSDYFGESKMGGLRMWNHLIYQRGGLGLHAGLKVIPASSTPDGEDHSVLIIGLSGTGKTTTTFARHLDSLPVQDDFVGLLPGGKILTTENGCFAKTYGLSHDAEPTIFGGVAHPDAWLENVHVEPDGAVDFFNAEHTRNGRGTFSLSKIDHHRLDSVPRLRHILLLNRSEHIIPAVARLDQEQVAAYFMLGETTGTSAGGTAERGKSLRVPGTNPFFFDDDALQANRLDDLLRSLDWEVGVYVLNTGRIGGKREVEGSKKVDIPATSAIVEGLVSGRIEWRSDDDFGYDRAVSVPGIGDPRLLDPRLLYRELGRESEYLSIVETLKNERAEYLAGYPGLRGEIVSGLYPSGAIGAAAP